MKILSTTYHDEFQAWTLPEWCAIELKKHFPEFEVVRLTARERVERELADTDIWLTYRVRPGQFSVARRLKWIHAPMAGLTWILIPEVVNSNVIVSNSKGVHAIPIAEHTLALMLQFSRRLAQCLEDQQRAVWRRRQIWESALPFNELFGKTVCVLGVGTIGLEIARRAKAFGMRVIGVRRNVDERVDAVDELYPPRMVDEILPRVDYLVIATPATAETTAMIGRRQLERLKPSAFLVNIARGDIVDQEALVEMLETERIAGAALDVFAPDPLPDGHPLFATKNLIITPHIAGNSPMLWHRVMDIWIENVHRFLAGKPLINQVDKARGY
jgi:phosphoglycerate dehydrogenase-like enzyme